MTETDPNEGIREIVDKLLGRSWDNVLSFGPPALDTSRPNIHDSKGEFQLELRLVEQSLGRLRKVFDALLGPGDVQWGDNPMLTRLQIAVDREARQRVAGLHPTTTSELIRKNKADTGF